MRFLCSVKPMICSFRSMLYKWHSYRVFSLAFVRKRSTVFCQIQFPHILVMCIWSIPCHLSTIYAIRIICRSSQGSLCHWYVFVTICNHLHVKQLLRVPYIIVYPLCIYMDINASNRLVVLHIITSLSVDNRQRNYRYTNNQNIHS